MFYLCLVHHQKQKRRVSELEKEVASAKQVYSNALRKLEEISDQIHEQRRTADSKLGQRESGVGAEAPPVISESLSPCQNNLDWEVEKLDMVIRQHRESTSPRQRSKDDMDLSPTKSYPQPQRPLSLTEGVSAPDPHAILTACLSTDHLDDISDSVSCKSEPMLDLYDDEEFDSGLDTLASRTISSLTFTGTEDLTDEKDSVFSEANLKATESTESCSADGPQDCRESKRVDCEPDSQRGKDACGDGGSEGLSESAMMSEESAVGMREEGEGNAIGGSEREHQEQVCDDIGESRESTTETSHTDTKACEDSSHMDKGKGDCIEQQKGEVRIDDAGVELKDEAERDSDKTTVGDREAKGVADGDAETHNHHGDEENQKEEDQLFIEEEETFV